MQLKRTLCWLWLGATLAFGGNAAEMLPINLTVLHHDLKLKAVLLSGDYQNTLAKPLRAWRGELHLTDGNEEIVLLLEQQARRPIRPGEWGVWSVWIDIDPTVPEHQALQRVQAEALQASAVLGRVLYADGSQEAF